MLVYSALDGWRRQMVEHGRELLGAALDLAYNLRDELERIPDVEVLDEELLGAEASHDLDRLQVLMDVSATGTSGYQAADWLRENCQIDVGMSDHRRILATLSFADGKDTAARLVAAMWSWRTAAENFDRPRPIVLPTPEEIQLETVMLRRRPTQDRRGVHGGQTRRVGGDQIAGQAQHLAMRSETKIAAKQRLRRRCAHQHDDLGTDRTQFGEQPWPTRYHLGPARRLVDAALTALRLLEFEVLDRVGDI